MRTPCGDEFRYEYDDANRLSIIASEFGERSFGYDSLDHIVSDTDALGNSYTAEFDLMGNLRRECSPKENASEEQSRYWRYAYDGMDNPILTESPLGVIYVKEYDGESRLTKEIHPESWDEETKTGAGTAYDYDADGRKIRTQVKAARRKLSTIKKEISRSGSCRKICRTAINTIALAG